MIAWNNVNKSLSFASFSSSNDKNKQKLKNRFLPIQNEIFMAAIDTLKYK